MENHNIIPESEGSPTPVPEGNLETKPEPNLVPISEGNLAPEGGQFKRKKYFWFNNLTKKQKILFVAGSIFFLALLAYSAYALVRQLDKEAPCEGSQCAQISTTPEASPTPSTTPAPQTFAYLDGTLIESGKENFRPLAVMIENHPDARPQAGLSQAGLVYEAIAEGGITRFMAVYTDPTQTIRLGPIRSARTIFVEPAKEIDAFYAHVGGSTSGLNLIKSLSVYDLDQFAIGSAAFARDLSRNVALEHTMYSSADKLWKVAVNTNKWPQEGSYSRWLMQDDVEASLRPAHQTISVDVSDFLYSVSWEYDPTSNSYQRSQAGSKHLDVNNGQQITAKNIILQEVTRQQTAGETTWTFTLKGTGKATIIQNGQVDIGTWSKQAGQRTQFYNSTGQEVKFVRGMTWIHFIHSDSQISY